MALSNKSPLGTDVSNIVAYLKERDGIPTSSFGDDLDADYVAPQIRITRDFYQEGLDQEYRDQMKLQSMMGEY